MRCLLTFFLSLLAAGHAQAEENITWDVTPTVCGLGQPFRMQVRIESDNYLGPAQQVGKEIKPPRGMALRFSGQVFRANTTGATLNFSGVAPESEGVYILPAFNVRFPTKVVRIPEISISVSAKTGYRKEGIARAELILPERTFYVGEKIIGSVILRGSEQETVSSSFGLECEAEGFSFQTEGSSYSQALPDGKGLLKPFELTPIRAGQSEFTLNGIMLVNTGANTFSATGRDRPYSFRRRLTVEHVPETGRPADWGGSIGKLETTPTLLSNRFPEVGEPIKLTVTLVGDGNLDRIVPPELPNSDNWDIAPISEKRQRRGDDRRSFVYTLSPRGPGELKTPAVRFTTFNPETRKFETVEFTPLAVKVTGTAPAKIELVTMDPAAKIGTPAAKLSTGLLMPSVTANALGVAKIEPLAASKPFWLTNTASFLALTVGSIIIFALGYLAAHPEILRHRRARHVLQKARREAQAALRQKDAGAYARAVVTGLRAGAAALLVAEAKALTQSDLLRVLPMADSRLLDEVFRAADGKKFGASAAPQPLSEDVQLQALLNTLEAQL